MVLLQLVWSKTFKNLYITNIRSSAPELICFAVHSCCAARLLLQIYSLDKQQPKVFIMAECLCVKQNGIFCLPAGTERAACPYYSTKKKKNLFGTKTSSSNKSWNKMKIQSREREDSNRTPQSIPQRKVLSPSTLSVFCSGIAYSCPKPSVFLSKGNNFLMCLRSWISMWKHNFQVFFIRIMEFYTVFFFFKSGCFKKMPTFFGRL